MGFVGRLSIRTKFALLAGIPVLGALILGAVIALQGQKQAAAAAALGSIEDVAQLSVRISGLIHALQLERARMGLHEGFEARGTDNSNRADVALGREYEQTDAAQGQLETFLAGHDLSRLPARLARDLGVARAQATPRRALQARLLRERVPIEDILNLYGATDDALVSATAALTELSDDGELLRSISSLVALSQLTERASREHALLSYVFAAREFPPGAFKTLVSLTTEEGVYADAFRASASAGPAGQYDAALTSEAALQARSMRERALRIIDDNIDIDAPSWFVTRGEALSQLQEIERGLLTRITDVATRKMAATRASVRLGLWLSAAVVLASGLLAWIIASGVTRAISDLSNAASRVRETKDFAIRAEKTSIDELGTLTDVFNEMLSTIQTRDAYLETQVAERTDELRLTVAELWSEMDLAVKIQTVLLPHEPQLSGYDIAATMVPASTVGGDYYDVFRLGDADWIFIGDVSGHGVTAGITMMIVQTAVRAVIQSAASSEETLTPKDVLARVNAAVRSNLKKINEDQYMTIMALQLEGGRVCYSGLHQDILVYRTATRRVERVEGRGMWLGLMDDISGLVEDDVLQLEEGDLLLLYTDGVTEVKVGDHRLGTDGLALILQRLANTHGIPAVLIKAVMDEISGSTFADDVTILAARYMPAKPTSARSIVATAPMAR